jgi:hypothetical protein
MLKSITSIIILDFIITFNYIDYIQSFNQGILKMDIKITESSPKALANKKTHENELYPFESLQVGQSFTVPTEEISWKSLRICVYQRNKKKLKRFAFVKHDDLGLCEVARLS